MARIIGVEKGKPDRIRQGDIIRSVDLVEDVLLHEDDYVTVKKITYPLVYVLSQDCDLEQHAANLDKGAEAANQDKVLFSVLVAPMYNALHVAEGEHLSQLGRSMASAKGSTIEQNKNPRYHYLRFPEHAAVVDSIIDFKHFFCVGMSHLLRARETSFVCSVSELYREDISQRFASFLSRIGLPD